MKLLLALMPLVALALGGSYDGFQLFEVTPASDAEVHLLFDLEAHGFFVDFFEQSDRPNEKNLFMVKKDDVQKLKDHLKANGVAVDVVHDNVQRLADEDRLRNVQYHLQRPYEMGKLQSYDFGQYHPLDEIVDFLKTLTADPEAAKISSIQSIGKSFENRDLHVVKIGLPKEGAAKPEFWIDCNIHAREWITSGTCVYIINDMITKYLAGDPTMKKYVEEIDWYIMPVLNPDGFVYSHEKSRYWRKTRSGPHSGSFGVDPNRNWDSRFGGAGTSSSPSSDVYRGPKPFSEPETKAASDFILAHKDTMKAFISVHSFSQLWLIPYSYARNTQPADGDELNDMSKKVVAAIRSIHGESYRDGTAANILYAVTGGSHDWAKENVGIKWCFSPESRPARSLGLSGFNPNPREIIPNAQELMVGFFVIADQIIDDQ
jgi:murein tripeptide amidase MpaA